MFFTSTALLAIAAIATVATEIDGDIAECTKLRTYTNQSTTIFPINESHNNGTNTLLIFYVKSNSSASISISSTTGQKTYEVILSSKNNAPSQIRLNQVDILAKHFEENTLSPNEWRPFWIEISLNGPIKVGKETESSAFLSFTPINHIGFASYNNAEVNWAFHCPQNNETDLTSCTNLRTRHYEYNVVFPIDDYIQQGNIIFLQFYVKAERDAHIILSPTSIPSKSDERAYEIVLGSNDNTDARIRIFRGVAPQTIYNEFNMLSPNEWRPFWIRVSPNGSIEVGKENGSPAFMSWKDESPTFDYYTLNSYDDGNVDWAIDCY